MTASARRDQQQPIPDVVIETQLFQAEPQASLQRNAFEVDPHGPVQVRAADERVVCFNVNRDEAAVVASRRGLDVLQDFLEPLVVELHRYRLIECFPDAGVRCPDIERMRGSAKHA